MLRRASLGALACVVLAITWQLVPSAAVTDQTSREYRERLRAAETFVATYYAEVLRVSDEAIPSFVDAIRYENPSATDGALQKFAQDVRARNRRYVAELKHHFAVYLATYHCSETIEYLTRVITDETRFPSPWEYVLSYKLQLTMWLRSAEHDAVVATAGTHSEDYEAWILMRGERLF